MLVTVVIPVPMTVTVTMPVPVSLVARSVVVVRVTVVPVVVVGVTVVRVGMWVITQRVLVVSVLGVRVLCHLSALSVHCCDGFCRGLSWSMSRRSRTGRSGGGGPELRR